MKTYRLPLKASGARAALSNSVFERGQHNADRQIGPLFVCVSVFGRSAFTGIAFGVAERGRRGDGEVDRKGEGEGQRKGEGEGKGSERDRERKGERERK